MKLTRSERISVAKSRHIARKTNVIKNLGYIDMLCKKDISQGFRRLVSNYVQPFLQQQLTCEGD